MDVRVLCSLLLKPGGLSSSPKLTQKQTERANSTRLSSDLHRYAHVIHPPSLSVGWVLLVCLLRQALPTKPRLA